MARLAFQYLAIHNNENLPQSIKIVPKWVRPQPNIKKPLIYGQIFLNLLLKRRNFAKSGHTAESPTGSFTLRQKRGIFALVFAI